MATFSIPVRNVEPQAVLLCAVRVLWIAVPLLLLLPLHLIWHLLKLPSPWAMLFLRSAARALGARVSVYGRPLRRDVFFVANHISWHDIPILAGITGSAFVAQDGVRDWPVIGWLAQRSGTLFIRRDLRRHTATINQQAAELLAQGDCIGLFPEATTTDGRHLLPFHSSLFQAAVIHQAPVMMLTIRYHLADGTIDTAPAYHGGLTLLDSFRAVLARQRIQVDVTAIGTLDTQGKTRREISLAAQTAIARHLNLPVQHKTPETPADPPAAAPSTDHPTDNPYPRPHAGSPH